MPPPHLQAMDAVCVVARSLVSAIWSVYFVLSDCGASRALPKLLAGEQSSSEREIFMPPLFPLARFRSGYTVSLLRSVCLILPHCVVSIQMSAVSIPRRVSVTGRCLRHEIHAVLLQPDKSSLSLAGQT